MDLWAAGEGWAGMAFPGGADEGPWTAILFLPVLTGLSAAESE